MWRRHREPTEANQVEPSQCRMSSIDFYGRKCSKCMLISFFMLARPEANLGVQSGIPGASEDTQDNAWGMNLEGAMGIGIPLPLRRLWPRRVRAGDSEAARGGRGSDIDRNTSAEGDADGVHGALPDTHHVTAQRRASI